MDPPTKKTRACVPCHERKVRCDLGQTGTPCTRCIGKDREQYCVAVARPQPGAKRKRTSTQCNSVDNSRIRRNAEMSPATELDIDPLLALANTATRTPISLGSDQGSIGHPSPRTTRFPGYPAPDPPSHYADPGATDAHIPRAQTTPGVPPQYTTSEDDAHLQTLCRMSERDPAALSPGHTGAVEPTRRVFEYYSDFNALSLLNEAIGRPTRRRLVPVDIGAPQAGSVMHRELGRLDKIDRAYLAQRRVHDLPTRNACEALLQLFYKHVYPYTPVVDRVQLARDVKDGNCSTFLLYCVFAITVPYSPPDLLRRMSFKTVTEAQRQFFTRARLLFDFGCEKNQLSLLQGSIFMSSFQNSFAPDKDFRFWFNNAVHTATLMGLHRRNIEQELHPNIHRVCRRIWWLLVQRDVLFSLAGFENVRRINDEGVDSRAICEEDWSEASDAELPADAVPPITDIQVQFFLENCKLTNLGARCLRLFRDPENAVSMDQVWDIGSAITAWRRDLAPELRADVASHWNDASVWVTVIHTLGFRLECLFYRTLRQRAGVADTEDAAYVGQRLLSAIFELSTVVRRAMAYEVLISGPPSIVVCTTQLLALQIETVLRPECTRSTRQALKAEIYTILAYLRDIEERWINAKWASRVFGWVVKRMGISLREVSGDSGVPGAADTAFLDGPAACEPALSQQRCPQQGTVQSENPRQRQQELDPAAYPDPQSLDPFEDWPESWTQDLIDEGLYDGQEQMMFGMFSAMFQ